MVSLSAVSAGYGNRDELGWVLLKYREDDDGMKVLEQDNRGALLCSYSTKNGVVLIHLWVT